MLVVQRLLELEGLSPGQGMIRVNRRCEMVAAVGPMLKSGQVDAIPTSPK